MEDPDTASPQETDPPEDTDTDVIVDTDVVVDTDVIVDTDLDCPAGTAGPACDPCPVGTYCPGGTAAGEILTCGLRTVDGFPECEGATPPAEALTALSAGSFACGITQAGGTLTCWGSDTFGRVSDAPTGTAVAEVDLAQYPGCILDGSGLAQCWGEPWNIGPTAPAVSTEILSALAVSQQAACGLRSSDGHVVCWGLDGPGTVTGRPVGEPFDQLSADGLATCGIRSADGAVVCWGDDAYGLVSDVPSGVFVAIDVAPYHACGVRDDDTVTCWGAVVVNP